MNSIITNLKDKATIVICNGVNMEMEKIFEFCGLFEPCILVIDDIDFVAGSRDNNNKNNDQLGFLLQALDGFIPNNVFILASTNDKKLVDEAAKRPGRFDLILDIGEIEADNYISLVRRETSDNNIIDLFDRQVLNKLEDKKVSGAFIVNLVKQLKTIRTSGEDINHDIFTDIFNLLYKGFYEYNDNAFARTIGFIKS
jgi:ATP-dependent 26S proteasome regulatory subunit